ncbi:MAG: peptidoglycan bridge formation glycyltransferase FemA/FemB family protein, partial [Chloroflexi bacterium]|nr:peptidoglycan bridge formation glycyltransferase FemA/FemB family protein [Chloroflexota bacterium]
QTWAWGELKADFGWTPVRLAVTQSDGEEGIVAGAQVLYRRLGPLSMGYLPKGPWFVQEADEASDALWQAIHRLSRLMRAVALKVEPEWFDEEAVRHAWLVGHGFQPGEPVQPRRTIVVDLTADEEEILARMKSKWRYNVRLSMRRGVEVREGTEKDLGLFYRLMAVTGERDEFGIHSEAYYRRAFELFAPCGRARLFLAYYDGQPLAGLMVFLFNRRGYYLYGASSDAHRELMPNHQLQWRAMQWAKEQGCISYDLWGITDIDPDSPSAELSGVERFKAGFGGQTVRTVGAYDYVYHRCLYGLAIRLRRRGLG